MGFFTQKSFYLCSLFLVSFLNCSREESAVKNHDMVNDDDTQALRSEFFESSGKDQGEICKPKNNALEKGDCQDGYICVPSDDTYKTGTCLKDCSKVVDEYLFKNPELCDGPRKCMLLKRGDQSPLGMFCVKPQKYQDMRCEAPLDENACASGLTCLPTAHYTNSDGVVIYGRYRCKQECSVEKRCENSNDSCLYPSYVRKESQSLDGKNRTMCSVSSCKSNDAACACDKSLGFNCHSLVNGVDAGVCSRWLGICGKSVKLSALKDFAGNNYLGETCNELSDNRFCEDMAAPFGTQCRTLSNKGEGVCLAPCSIPALDRDGDGVISQKESGFSAPCPDGYVCETSVASKVGMNFFIEVNGVKKTCNPANCTENKTCPNECGPGDAQCLRVGSGRQTQFFCGAPAGTCVEKR